MSKEMIKCPHCDRPPEYELWGSTAMYCCKHCGFLGNQKLWQALIQSQRDLQIAVDFIKCVEDGEELDNFGICQRATETLAQITHDNKDKQ